MKKRIGLIFLSASIVLCGCHSIKNDNAIKVIKNLDHEPISINAETVEYLIKQKYSFHLLAYTEACSYCDKAKTNIEKLSKEVDYVIYQIEIYDASKEYLVNNLPDIFNSSDVYPSLYIFNGGNTSYKSDYSDLITYSKVKKMIKAYSVDTNIATFNTLDSYKTYKKQFNDYLLFTFDSGSSDENITYSKYLYSRASESKKNTLIIDKNTAKPDLLKEIYEYFETDECFLSIVENGQIKTTLEYENQSDLEINKLINSFFDVNAVNRSC